MAKKSIEQRRTVVSELYLNGLSTREIAQALFEMGIFNESTKEAFSQTVIVDDIKAIKAEWKDKSYTDMEALKAEHIETLKQLRKLALQKGDVKTALSSVVQEGKVLGLEAPTKNENVHSFTMDAKQAIIEKLNALKSPVISPTSG